jgi:hypothetical protein
MACGVKQVRPTDSHWASVGGVTLVEMSCQSLTVGCGTGAAVAEAWPANSATRVATTHTASRLAPASNRFIGVSSPWSMLAKRAAGRAR